MKFKNISSKTHATTHATSKNQIILARGNVTPTQNEGETDLISELALETSSKHTRFIITTFYFTICHQKHTYERTSYTI